MPQNKYTNLFLFSSLHFPGVIFASCEVFSYVYLSACEHELGISVVIDLKVYEYHSFCLGRIFENLILSERTWMLGCRE
jgi:hypothetical protein